jgi:hypothetical protein
VKTAFGEDRFNDGEYDTERDKLELLGDDRVPRMVTFEHTFFNADGTLQRTTSRWCTARHWSLTSLPQRLVKTGGRLAV